MPTIVGVFDNGTDVERALYDLESYSIRQICVIDHEREFMAMLETGTWVGLDEHTPDYDILHQDIQALRRMGVSKVDAFAYAESVQHGKKLVAVRANSSRVREILEILSGANAITEPISS